MSTSKKTATRSRMGLGQVLSGLVAIVAGLLGMVLFALRWVCRNAWTYYRPRPWRALVDSLLLIGFISVFATGMKLNEQLIDSQITAELVEEIDRDATFKRNFRRRTASKASSGNREFMNVGAPAWLRQTGIRAIILEGKLAGLSNEEIAVLLATADRESGFNPLAKAPTTTACGLFQFIERTGSSFGLPASECMNPRANARAGVKHFRWLLDKTNLNFVSGEERLVRMFRQTYCMHHDGPNAEGCSQTANVTIARGLDLLFTAHRKLEEAEYRRDNSPGFLIQSWEITLKMFRVIRNTASSAYDWLFQTSEA